MGKITVFCCNGLCNAVLDVMVTQSANNKEVVGDLCESCQEEEKKPKRKPFKRVPLTALTGGKEESFDDMMKNRSNGRRGKKR